MSAPRPITLLIAALGGEGGGVLTDWIVSAATARGFPVQSTSIPGVAQRTGATTYYIEIMPATFAELGGRRPVMALSPGGGDVDIVVASELMEAARAVSSGFVSPDRTLMIASTSRALTIAEKSAMGDGRVDSAALVKTMSGHAQRTLLFDLAAAAREAGAMINAAMLGALAASGRLPMTPEDFTAAISADGKAVAANLRGFRAGFEAASRADTPTDGKRRSHAADSLAVLEARASATIPQAARDIVIEGLRRTCAYQDLAYAGLYLDRLSSFDADGRLLIETARHLAVRMTYEDIIRVAEAKIAPDRFARIRAEIGAGDEVYRVFDVLKPGIEELCQILPPSLARRVLAVAARRGWLARHWGMEIESTSLSGYLRFRVLAALKPLRPRGYRFREEQAAIEQWLGLIVEAAPVSTDLAVEIAECARLIKGYGDTWKHGFANYTAILETVIRPALAGRMPPAQAADAIASARAAALIDPEGQSLAKCLAAIAARAAPAIAAE